MARHARKSVEVDDGLREALLARYRRLQTKRHIRDAAYQRIIDRLEMGLPLTLPRWKIPEPWRPDEGSGYDVWRLEPDDSLTRLGDFGDFRVEDEVFG